MEKVTSAFVDSQPTSAVRILYDRYAPGYAESWKNAPADYAEAIRSMVEGETAILFAQHVLDHPEELAEAHFHAAGQRRGHGVNTGNELGHEQGFLTAFIKRFGGPQHAGFRIHRDAAEEGQ